jgi:hypothetical protein
MTPEQQSPDEANVAQQAALAAAKGSASRRAFRRRYGPMQIHTGYVRDIEDYASTLQDWWTVWEAARKWQRNNPNEK